MKKALNTIIGNLANFLFLFCFILVLCTAIFWQPLYYNSQPNLIDALSIIVFSLIGLIAILAMIKLARKWQKKQYYWVEGIIAFLLLIIELYFSWHFIGAQGVDDFDMKRQAFFLANGGRTWTNYFSFASNNVNATILYSWLFNILKALHISLAGPAVNVCMFLMSDIMLFCGWQIVRRHFRLNMSLLYSLIILAYYPLWATSLFIYTDPIALFFLMLGANALDYWLMHRKTGQPWNYVWFVLAAICLVLASLMKPNAIIAVIALYLFVFLVSHHWQKLLINLLVVSAVFVGGFGFQKQIRSAYDFQVNQRAREPATYWFGMGLTRAKDGVVGAEPAFKISEKTTYAQKQKTQTKYIKNQLHKLGPRELGHQFFDKSRLQWSFGMMGMDARGFGVSQRFNRFYTKLFGPDDGMLRAWCQVIYVILLIGAVLDVCFRLKNWKTAKPDIFDFLRLYVLGIYLFHTFLWEVETRYAYIAGVPILLLGIQGLSELVHWFAPRSLRLAKYLKTQPTKTKAALWIGVLAVFTTIYFQNLNLTTSVNGRAIPVISQLTPRPELTTLKSGQSLTQPLTISQSFDQMTLNAYSTVAKLPKKPQLKVELIPNHANQGKVQSQLFVQNSKALGLSGGAGDYQLKLTNIGKKALHIQVNQGYGYPVLQRSIKQLKDKYLNFEFIRFWPMYGFPYNQYMIFMLFFLVVLLLAVLILGIV